MAKKMGKNVTVKYEEDLTKEDVKNKDIIVSLGGDHTYLVASALIWDRRIPILGINSNSKVYTGALTSCSINYHDRFK